MPERPAVDRSGGRGWEMNVSVQITPFSRGKTKPIPGNESGTPSVCEPESKLVWWKVTTSIFTATKLCELSKYFSFHISRGNSGINNNAPTCDEASSEAHSGETPDGELLCKA